MTILVPCIHQRWPDWTSAGMTAGIDLVLALIDNDLGPDTAKTVARLLVMNQRRLGGQKAVFRTPRHDAEI
ncbi:transcriptional regulator GlxA family with amidase domain [Nitrobacteraceae bacterium AZCC 2161]